MKQIYSTSVAHTLLCRHIVSHIFTNNSKKKKKKKIENKK